MDGLGLYPECSLVNFRSEHFLKALSECEWQLSIG